MAIIFSYPVVIPTADDYVLGTDVTAADKPTKNFTVQSIIDLVTVSGNDLQAVLDNGNTAAGKDIDITNSAFRGTSFYSVGGITLDGTTGTGFTAFTSTAITGTLQTAAQPNITSLGNLTALVIDGAISGTNVITSTTLVGASNTNIASTLAIKTYVDSNPSGAESLAATLLVGNTTGATKIEVDNTGGGIDFIDDAKLRLGTGDDFEMYHAAADNNTYLKETGAGALELWASTTTLKNAGGTETLLTATDGGSVDLYYNNIKSFETTADGTQVTAGVLTIPVGSAAAPTLTFAGDPNTGIYRAGADLVGISGGGTLGLTVDATDTTVEGNLTVLGTFTASSAAQASFGGKVTVSTPTAGTDAATKAYVDSLVAGKTLEYAGDATGPFALNLASDDLEFNGDANITVTAATVAANKGIVTIDLNNSVTITGTSKAGTFTTTAGTASWSTTVMTGFTSITSTTFIGALTGNASTATALASSGAIALTGDTTSTGGPYTYTSGGALSIATSIADTTVTAKVLTNLPSPTSSAIAATDTILAAMAKLQGQITGIPQGLVYQGTWNANTNTPTLASGTGTTGYFYIVSVAGSTNLDGITDWQVGDWAIFIEQGASDQWEKIDNTSAITGTGTANKIAKWTGSSTLATGLIEDDGTDVTIGNSGNLIVEGNTTLGNADADTTTVKGPATFEETSRFNVGISLGAATYGTAGQVLTSGGGAATVNTWTTPTTGVVESITGSTGITIGGTAAIPTVAITYAGASNAILAATGATPVAADTIWFSDADDSTIKKALISALPLDNYASWTLAGDSGASQTISSTNTATMAGGTGITTVASATDTLTINIDTVGTDNAIEVLTAATAATGDFMWFSDIDDSNTLKKSTLANLPFLPAVTGTQYTLPMFATTSTLGDSIISQNAGATQATVTGILDVTSYVQLGSITKILSADTGSIFISSRTAAPGSDDVKNTALGIDALNSLANTAGANGNENVAVGYRALEDVTTGYYNTAVGSQAGLQLTTGHSSVAIGHTALDAMTVGDHNVAIGNNALTTLNESSSNDSNSNVAIGSGAAENKATGKDNVFIGRNAAYNKATGDENIYIGSGVAGGAGVESGATTIGYGINSNGSNTITLGHGSATVFYGGQNGIDIGSAVKPWGDLYVDNGFFDGNITVDGSIIHGGGGGGTAKGGQFTKLYTTGNAGVAGVAFTISRATTGAMIFDVMLTSDTSTACAVAKKYTVVKSYGASPLYNKILDTGPDFDTSDITVAFAQDTTDLSIKCTITPVYTNTQKIGITLDLGYGQHDATVVMN